MNALFTVAVYQEGAAHPRRTIAARTRAEAERLVGGLAAQALWHGWRLTIRILPAS